MNMHLLRTYKSNILYRKKIRQCDMTPITMDDTQAISILQAAHPDLGTSCILKQKRTFSNGNFNGNSEDPGYLLDIIVPAYNVEQFIIDCLDSILNQKTHYPYRVIVVNDGSSDHTANLLERYADRPNILIITQENKGLSGARNAALNHADARYLMFVDSDDRIPEDAIEKLLSTAMHNKSDIVAGSYCNIWKRRSLRGIHRQQKGLLDSDMLMTGHSWGKIYLRKLFDHICFPEGYWFEDSLMHQIIFPSAHNKFGISHLVYERRINPSSITHTAVSNPKSIDSVWVTMRLLKDRQALGIKKDEEYLEYILTVAMLTQVRLANLDKQIQKASFVVFQKILKDTFPESRSKKSALKEVEYYIRKGFFEAFSLFCKFKY